MDSCKFCGAAFDGDSIASTTVSRRWFPCGASVLNDHGELKWTKGESCDADELARYQAMFPVAPWSTDPITAEVCERLGMPRVRDGSESRLWPTYRTTKGAEVLVFLAPPILEVFHDGKYQRNCNTAGQLSRLVAARKTTTDDQPGG